MTLGRKAAREFLPARSGSLETVGQVKSELGRLYREAKRGKRDTQDAYRLARILLAILACIQGHEVEARLERLERGGKEGGT